MLANARAREKATTKMTPSVLNQATTYLLDLTWIIVPWFLANQMTRAVVKGLQ
jgi:hypothetical protein